MQGKVWVHGRGRVYVGNDVRFVGSPTPIELHAIKDESEIHIGDGVVIEPGVSIECDHSVRIESGSRIGAYVKMMDTHFHELGDRSTRPEAIELVIGAGSVVGARAILLAGSALGAGAMVAPGTVVTRRIPAGASVEGLPARLTAKDVAGESARPAS